jgi:hypothetical protein
MDNDNILTASFCIKYGVLKSSLDVELGRPPFVRIILQDNKEIKVYSTDFNIEGLYLRIEKSIKDYYRKYKLQKIIKNVKI